MLDYILTSLQEVASILMKPLAKGKFAMLRANLGLLVNIFLAKRER